MEDGAPSAADRQSDRTAPGADSPATCALARSAGGRAAIIPRTAAAVAITCIRRAPGRGPTAAIRDDRQNAAGSSLGDGGIGIDLPNTPGPPRRGAAASARTNFCRPQRSIRRPPG